MQDGRRMNEGQAEDVLLLLGPGLAARGVAERSLYVTVAFLLQRYRLSDTVE